ncbi:M14 family zinc carboxypeptidase [Actinomycetospora straminea]|uniref:Peptidase M14 domain-containing protein n=1 Tax=Actinomycetospora straminea TaxID=663607 RepID=A0ABP9FD66_9PSEU|nr:M14 family zinc carboxypeptidase [Actinomycetospora straminea]MDD7933668.1 M14 family zinc carboxypeptidase [Actinomycetospora straminea]
MSALPGWLVAEMAGVPPRDTLAGADELAAGVERLAADHPRVVTRRRVGTSGQGEPLTALTIGAGSTADGPARPSALVIGLPHPNEPVGGLTALHLARRLAQDDALRARLGLVWHVVPCIDPDGLRLNEGWLAGPFTREHYARHLYRQAGHEQIEWSFPLAHKDAWFDAVLPETLALMRLVDDHRPVLMASLHNAEVGGVYHYLSRPEPALHPLLQAIPAQAGLTLHRGEPEAPWIPLLAEGIYRSLDIRDAYDHLEVTGEQGSLVGGNSTGAYAARHGTLTLVTEVPYWRDDRLGDGSESGHGRSALLAAAGAAVRELATVLRATLDAVGGAVHESPFVRATRFFAPFLAGSADDLARRAAAEPDRPATVAEVASLAEITDMSRLRYAGMLLRALDAEIALGNVRPAVRSARTGLAEHFAAWCAEAAGRTPADTVPIRDLVAVQAAAVLAAADHLAAPDPP